MKYFVFNLHKIIEFHFRTEQSLVFAWKKRGFILFLFFVSRAQYEAIISQ